MKIWGNVHVLRAATLLIRDATAADMMTANSLENSRGRDTSEQIKQSTHGNDQMMKILRKELDEMKKAMKGKTAINLDGMLKRTYSPFTSNVLECPLLAKFHHS